MKTVVSLSIALLVSLLASAQGINFKMPERLPFTKGTGNTAIVRSGSLFYFAQPADNGIQITLTDTTSKLIRNSVITGTSANSVSLAVGNERVYLFCLLPDGSIQYAILSEDGSATDLQPLAGQGADKMMMCMSGNKGLIASTTTGKKKVSLLFFDVQPDGRISAGKSTDLPAAKEPAMIQLITSGENAAIISWQTKKTNRLNYQVIDLSQQAVTGDVSEINVPDVQTSAMLMPVPGMNRQLFIWQQHKGSNKWLYGFIEGGRLVSEPAPLPPYMQNDWTFSASAIYHNTLQLVLSGDDQQMLLITCPFYNTANWIANQLLPLHPHARLKDIVIPGSHDAGMSVLTAAGGKDPGIINECNTLTQVYTIQQQLEAGIRMFDLRIENYNGSLYTKHAPSNCMEDAVAGAYGEKLATVLKAVKDFLSVNKQEFVILSFCHFCSKGMPVNEQAAWIIDALGKDIIADGRHLAITDIPVRELCGKVLLTFEDYSLPDLPVVNNTMTELSDASLNYRRCYAATNSLVHMVPAQKHFFDTIKTTIRDNDIIRLDWQLTEGAQEAAFICNDFQSSHTNPIIEGTKALVNALNKNKSIRDLARSANMVLGENIINWVNNGTISHTNKPNILYVDIAGSWITDLCLYLNKQPLYQAAE